MSKPSRLAKMTVTPIRAILYAGFALLILTGVVLFAVFRDDISGDTLNHIAAALNLRSHKGNAAGNIAIDRNPQNQFGLCGDELVVLSPERLVWYERNGEERYSAALRMANPILRAAGETVLVFDRGRKSAMIIPRSGEPLSLEGAVVLDALVTEENYSGVVTELSGYKSKLTLYDPKRQAYFEWYSAESGIITHFALTPKGKNLVVSSLIQDGEECVNRLIFLDTGQTDPIAQTDIRGQLALYMAVTDDGICLIFEEDVRFYSLTGEFLAQVDLEGRVLMDARVSERLCVLALARKGNEHAVQLWFLDGTGEKIQKLTLEDSITAMNVTGGYTALLQNNTLSLYNDKGELTFTQDGMGAYKHLLIHRDGSVLLAAQDHTWWIR